MMMQWCCFCEDRPAVIRLQLIWADTRKPIDGVLISKLVRGIHACASCADDYEGTEVCLMEQTGRVILLAQV